MVLFLVCLCVVSNEIMVLWIAFGCNVVCVVANDVRVLWIAFGCGVVFSLSLCG